MIKKWCKNKFVTSNWRFVGRLPKQYEKNLILITPHTSFRDYWFFLAISEITKIPKQFFVERKWFHRFFSKFLIRNCTFPFVKAPDIDTVFSAKEDEVRKINVVVQLDTDFFEQKGETFEFYKFVRNKKIPISLVAIDRVEHMIKFHTVFFPSKSVERDLIFMKRYFNSHDQKNKNYLVDINNFKNSL